jgi:hypothetical protein
MEIEGNSLGAEGMTQLSRQLQGNTTLRTLDVAANQMGSGGVRVLLREVWQLQGLGALDLASNGIGAEGAEAVGCALAEGSLGRLRTLKLDSNP